ncbi:MAG: hypothetical protein QXG00_07600 [Candidatus Woesearchaeota archaeon]
MGKSFKGEYGSKYKRLQDHLKKRKEKEKIRTKPQNKNNNNNNII